MYVFFQVPDWATEMRERERLFVDIIRLADQLGVQFAFPTHTVHMYKEEHAAHQSAYEMPKGTHDGDAAQVGLRAAHDITKSQSWRTERPGAVHFKQRLKGSERDISDRGGDG